MKDEVGSGGTVFGSDLRRVQEPVQVEAPLGCVPQRQRRVGERTRPVDHTAGGDLSLGQVSGENAAGLLTSDVMIRPKLEASAHRIAADDVLVVGAFNEGEERAALGYVLECRRRGVGGREVEPAHRHLGELAAGHGIGRLEGSVGIAVSHRRHLGGGHSVGADPPGV